jgi:hypothetical protein
MEVVASTDNTTITTITITPSVTVGSHPAGVPYSITLNQGQTYQLRTITTTDLTGTIVSANNPVAVYGGNDLIDIQGSEAAANFITEEFLPVNDWGTHFLTEPFATRLDGDPFRILASADNTHVTINGVLVATLNHGQYYDQAFTAPSGIVTDQSVMVAQFSFSHSVDNLPDLDADPSMTQVPATSQYLSSYQIATPSRFSENFVNLTVPAADVGTVTLDGATLATGAFTPIGSGAYYGAKITVNQGSHTLAGPQPFGAIAYGYDVFDAYSYPTGLNLPGPVVVSQVSLTPKTADDLTGTTATLQAAVTDQNGNPVPNFPVTFQVSGANPTTGSGQTNANGRVTFTYVGANVGTDSIAATAASFTDTATVNWFNNPPTVNFTSPANNSTLASGAALVLS